MISGKTRNLHTRLKEKDRKKEAATMYKNKEKGIAMETTEGVIMRQTGRERGREREDGHSRGRNTVAAEMTMSAFSLSLWYNPLAA